MNNYDDDEDEDQVQKIVIPKYKLLYQDGEVTSKLPVPEEEDKPAETEEEKKEQPPAEEEETEGPKTTIEKILTMIAEITQGAKLTDKELCQKLKEKLDKTPELNQPAVSSSQIEEHGVWQVIIGKQFAASVTFDAKLIYYFLIEEKLGERSTEEKSDEKLDDGRKYFLVFRS